MRASRLVVNHDTPSAQDPSRGRAVAASHVAVVDDLARVRVPNLDPERVGIVAAQVAIHRGDEEREVPATVDRP